MSVSVPPCPMLCVLEANKVSLLNVTIIADIVPDMSDSFDSAPPGARRHPDRADAAQWIYYYYYHYNRLPSQIGMSLSQTDTQ